MKALVIFAMTTVAYATTFGTGVSGTVEGNTFDGQNVPVITSPDWHAALGPSIWESVSTDSTVVPSGTKVDFWFLFDAAAGSTAQLGILADDGAVGYLNGVNIFGNLGAPPANVCNTGYPNCTQPLWLDITQDLLPHNRLDVVVWQNTAAFGIDDVINVQSPMIPPDPPAPGTPEPSTLAMFAIGGGLLAFRIGVRRWA